MGTRGDVLVEILAPKSTPQRTTSTTNHAPKKTQRSPARRAIIAAQPDWQWQNLRVRLTDNGTRIASYGHHRGQHRFEKRGARFPQHFSALIKLAWDGEWSNPRSGQQGHERVRKSFARLRAILTRLIPIPNEPFHFEDGIWTPHFQLELDGTLERAMVTRSSRNTSDDDPEDAEIE